MKDRLRACGVVALLTDFGLQDTYVGVMKGVILGVSPDARIVDLSHDVPPQDVGTAVLHLAGAVSYFPRGTVHVVVVDPGVGTKRRAIAVEGQHAFYVAPDNGVLGAVMYTDPPVRAVSIENRACRLPEVSRTFHGRDIFAPAAAHLARGIGLDALGPVVDAPRAAPLPRPTRDPDGTVHGTIQHVDRFGNGITNLPATMVPEKSAPVFEVCGVTVRTWALSYEEAKTDALLALAGSTGFIEIAVRNGSARERLGLRLGTPVLMHP